MNQKQLFEAAVKNLDYEILNLHVNNHKRRKYVRSLLTDELILFLYGDEQMSANAIAAYFQNHGIKISGADYIISRLKVLNVQTRDISTSANMQSVRCKQKNTLKQKYGVENISQIEDVKQKKKQQCINKYGVDNNFKSAEIKNKIKEYWQREYGANHVSEVINRKCYSLTKPHRAVIDILNALNVSHEFETNKYFRAYNNILQKRFCPRVDLYIPHLKLVIEVFGSYWHANPKSYKENDLFYTFYGKMTAQQIWLKDKIKLDHIKSLSYNIEVVWDDEITTERIQEILNKYENQKH
jgi:G:T-mismatch repair DNA endonuclease (very short patch repair protein)